MTYDDLVVLDFETYYSKDYSLALAKYNVSEYVRDPQFLIHGVGIKCAGHPTYWVSGHDQAIAELRSLELEDRPVCAHNMAFDGFILHEHADIHPAWYCDTLSMARAAIGHHTKHNLDTVADLLGIGRKTQGLEDTKNKCKLTYAEQMRLSKYCINDVDLCYEVFQRLKNYIPEKEMALIDLTMRMFCQPVFRVDIDLVEEEIKNEQEAKKLAVNEADTHVDVLMSNEKFADLLRSLDVEPPLKVSPRTGKLTYAFAKADPGFKALLSHQDDAVRTAAEARQAVKSTINETRAVRIRDAGLMGKPLPVLLNYAGAHTFRWSGGNKLNLQNLPRGGALRRAIIAPDNHQILVLDLSQIEARITVWLAGQLDVLRAFAELDAGIGEDVYKLMAAKIYAKSVERISSTERFIGKVCVLGLGFGMGWRKLQMTLAMGFMGQPVEISEAEARHIVATYRRANPFVVQFWDQLTALLGLMATKQDLDRQIGPVRFMYRMIELPSGLALKYPGLTLTEEGTHYQSRNGTTSIWGGMLLENLAQALARCVISDAMYEISKFWKIASMTHDEIISVVPDDQVEYAYNKQLQIMTTPPAWAPDLPLAAEGGYDKRYSK